MLLIGSSEAVLLVAQPKSGSTSLMATLGQVAGLRTIQEFGEKLGEPSSFDCADNATVNREILEELSSQANENGTRLKFAKANFDQLLKDEKQCFHSWTAFFSKHHGHPHEKNSCFRVLPHSDMWNLYKKTADEWMTSKTTLYKQHVVPTDHNLDLIAEDMISKRKDRIVLLLRDPIAAAVAYLFVHYDAKKNKPPRVDPCHLFGLALGLTTWRNNWLKFAEAHPESVFVLDFEDLYSNPDPDHPKSDASRAYDHRRCQLLEKAVNFLGHDAKVPLFSKDKKKQKNLFGKPPPQGAANKKKDDDLEEEEEEEHDAENKEKKPQVCSIEMAQHRYSRHGEQKPGLR